MNRPPILLFSRHDIKIKYYFVFLCCIKNNKKKKKKKNKKETKKKQKKERKRKRKKKQKKKTSANPSLPVRESSIHHIPASFACFVCVRLAARGGGCPLHLHCSSSFSLHTRVPAPTANSSLSLLFVAVARAVLPPHPCVPGAAASSRAVVCCVLWRGAGTVPPAPP